MNFQGSFAADDISETVCPLHNGVATVFSSIVTASVEMQKVFHVAEKVAPTASSVLILGESGTGKELIARAVHELSGRTGAFVPVNCGAIPDNLLESELFGYERGAFTGASTSKPGRFVLANQGTIFLDEIGEMSPHLQVKLLRVLQERVVEPVGGTRSTKVNVRVIAATNVDLAKKVKEGSFREDLYYRLLVVPVELPPLRARRGDIPLLIQYFSKRFQEQVRQRPLRVGPEAMQQLCSYSWPGNVRELENLVERLSILVDSDVVEVDDLPLHISSAHQAEGTLPYRFPVILDEGIDFNELVDSFENTLIMQALEKTGGNKKAASKLLNLNRTTLVEKIKKKGLESLELAHVETCSA